ncbi:hypothetical protein AMTRI_Chr02g211740 [Amborella trichopoda]
MATTETKEKQEASGPIPTSKDEVQKKVALLLRFLAFGATLSATLVMVLNKQTSPVTVVYNAPVLRFVTAKFYQTHAFVFFVVANAIACLYSLVMLLVCLADLIRLLGNNSYVSKVHGLLVIVLDLVMVALVTAGASAATSVAELGKNGNKHANWSKICDKFETYCDHGAGALIASFIGALIFIFLTLFSITDLYKEAKKVPKSQV